MLNVFGGLCLFFIGLPLAFVLCCAFLTLMLRMLAWMCSDHTEQFKNVHTEYKQTKLPYTPALLAIGIVISVIATLLHSGLIK